MEEFKIKTPVFEGPLDLLLDLIEKRKLFVNEISLAAVTEDFLNFLKNKKISLYQISYFLVIAATLILIKSKSLLPNFHLTKEEESQIEDLEKRLLLYQFIRKMSQEIKKKFGQNIIYFSKGQDLIFFTPSKTLTIGNILKTIQLISKSNKLILPEVEIKKTINIQEVLDDFQKFISERIQISFFEFAKKLGSSNEREAKIKLIVSFLALLELTKNGFLEVCQETCFDDIICYKKCEILEKKYE